MFNPDKTETEAGTVASIVGKANTPLINVDPEGLAIFPDGKIKSLELESMLDNPKRKRASVHLSETHSFIKYVVAHKSENSTHLFGIATENGGSFTALLDYHDRGAEGNAQWCTHSCQLTMETTPEWRRWMGKNAIPMPQEVFAEFIEDNMADIIRPDAGQLLDIAQLLTGTKAVVFKSGKNLKNGAITFEYSELVETGGRANGDLQVPDKITLGICPFVGGLGVELEARLRFRISEAGKLSFSYILNRPFKVIEAAFDLARTEIEEETGLPVHLGSAVVTQPTT